MLYGSGLQGRRVTARVAAEAAEQAEAIYTAIIAEREATKRSDELVTRASEKL
jgi:hypothetical protein